MSLPPCLRQWDLDQCPFCYSWELHLDPVTKMWICSSCGIEQRREFQGTWQDRGTIMRDGARKRQEVPRRFSVSHYKRLAHFRETMARIQGVERVPPISQQELDRIRRYWYRDEQESEIPSLKAAMRHAGCQHLYPHAFHVRNLLMGNQLLSFSETQVQALETMFLRMQQPFAQVAPERANMISYFYVIQKLCELRGWHDAAACLPILKSRHRVENQERLWRRLCKASGFRFISSL